MQGEYIETEKYHISIPEDTDDGAVSIGQR
jgi:hypothetical protein